MIESPVKQVEKLMRENRTLFPPAWCHAAALHCSERIVKFRNENISGGGDFSTLSALRWRCGAPACGPPENGASEKARRAARDWLFKTKKTPDADADGPHPEVAIDLMVICDRRKRPHLF